MYDLIIIGGGPAGLTAATYAIRKHLNALLISPDLGGKASARMNIEGRDTYRVINGADVVRRFQNEIEYLDFARLLERVKGLQNVAGRFYVTTESGRCLEARTVVLATGADPVRLDVPGADRYRLRGISYSTVSYAPLYEEKQVAVVGSGEMALRGAAELAQIAKRVYLISSNTAEQESTAPLSSALARRLTAAECVTIFPGWQPVAVDGDGYLRQLTIRSAAGEERSLDVDVVFVELGLRPHSQLVEGWVTLDPQKRVVVDYAARTSVPGLFAAGDVTHLPAEQVLIAVAEGAKAALSACDYLLHLDGSSQSRR